MHRLLVFSFVISEFLFALFFSNNNFACVFDGSAMTFKVHLLFSYVFLSSHLFSSVCLFSNLLVVVVEAVAVLETKAVLFLLEIWGIWNSIEGIIM